MKSVILAVWIALSSQFCFCFTASYRFHHNSITTGSTIAKSGILQCIADKSTYMVHIFSCLRNLLYASNNRLFMNECGNKYYYTYMYMYMYIYIHIPSCTHTQTHTDRQTDRHTHTYTYIHT